MKIDLIFDGENFQHRSIHSFSSRNKIALSTNDDCDEFCRKLAMDFCYQIRIWNKWLHNVYYTNDSKPSWRHLETESDDYELKYKAQRIKHDQINWDNFTSVTNDFKNIISKNVNMVTVEKAEGDDAVACLAINNLNNNISSIVVSSDNDLKQLTTFKDGNFIIFYSVVERCLYVHPSFIDFLKINNDDYDIFNMPDYSNPNDFIELFKKDFNQILDSNSISIKTMDANYHILVKIICGDKGDNVEKLKSGFGIKKVDIINKNIDFKFNEITDVMIDSIVNQFLVIAKLDNTETEFNLYKNKLKRNIKLMILNEEYIPSEIWNNILKKYKEESLINIKNMESLHVLLKGTKYLKEYVHGTEKTFQKIAKTIEDNNGLF